ncbi:MAG TPA: hypothetical protein VNE39_24150 [Planctomycetota bacterium]|nr:hypothetical protein [Planctomycetota bacterium]
MPETLVFRTRYDTAAFFLLALGALVAAVCLLIIGPVSAVNSYWLDDVPILLIAYALVTAAACAWRWRRVVLTEGGIERRWLWFRRAIPWEDITDVRLPIHGLFGSPAIVLWLRHQRPWRLCLALYRPMRISAAYRDYERLVREILARVPHAKLSDAAERHLAAPRRVALRHRLPAALLTIASLAMLAWVFDWVLWGERWLFDRPMSGVYALALMAAFMAVLAAGPLDREWCWKSKLMLLYPLLIAFLGPLFLACALYFGVWGQFLVVCAACAALGIGNLAACLPLRRGWLVAAAYGICLVAAVAPAVWRACREPVPFRKAMALPDHHPKPFLWSPDGRTLCVFDYRSVAGQYQELCHLIDAVSLEKRTFPLVPTEYSHSPAPRPLPAILAAPSAYSLFPTSRQVLIPVSQGTWPDSRAALWVLDTASGATTEAFSADGSLYLSPSGSASPDHSQVVFVAESETEKALHVLRLSDLKVERVELNFDLKGVYYPRYRSDGALIFHELYLAESDSFTLWLKMPGDPKPKPLYQLTRARVASHISSDGRWAAVASCGESGGDDWHWEIFDLLTGHGRLHVAPGVVTRGWAVWAPDSCAFAYVTEKGGKAHIVLVDPAAGHTKCWPATDRDLMHSLDSLSCGGRYAAFWTRSVVAPFHIMDMDTGRTVRLLRAPHYTDWEGVPPSWSPVGHRLAMECTDALFPRPTCALYLFDLAPR